MGITDLIACFIRDTLESENGCAELQRAQLAEQFGCVPSQINYVISTRFSPEHGYLVESRRGGGGYIRIRRVQPDTECMIMHTVNAVGDEIDSHTVNAFLSNLLTCGGLDTKTARLMAAATDDNVLRLVPPEVRGETRAKIFKQMLINVVC